MANHNCSNSECDNLATVYAGGTYSGDWADYYCNDHIPTGFQVMDRLKP